jgi:hypothetical protein
MFFRKRSHDALDDVLFTWPSGDAFRVRDMLRSIEVKGITGSGKSSGSGATILDEVLKHPRSTVMIIAQKPEERDIAVEMCRRRKKKLVVIEEGGQHRCNFFDDELKAGADALGMTEFITTLGEGLEAEQGGGRTNERFWKMLEKRIIFNAVEAVRQGTGQVTAPALLEFLTTAPYSAAQINDPQQYQAWQQRFHYQTMNAAIKRVKPSIDAQNWKTIEAFWGTEFPGMDEKPRSSGLAGVMNTLHTANTGLAWEMAGTTTNASPRMVDDGVSFLINFPFSIYGPTGRYLAAGWKYKLQKHVLRRKWTPGNYWNVLVCDEMQESVTDFDSRYLAQCRSHGGCVFALTQTINSELSQLGHQAKVRALLGNYGLHIYHLCDADTAQYASGLLGQQRESFVSMSPLPEKDDDYFAPPEYSFSISEQYQAVLQPRVFMSGLRTGGSQNDYCVDGVVVRPGEPFRDGNNWQLVSFRQK